MPLWSVDDMDRREQGRAQQNRTVAANRRTDWKDKEDWEFVAEILERLIWKKWVDENNNPIIEGRTDYRLDNSRWEAYLEDGDIEVWYYEGDDGDFVLAPPKGIPKCTFLEEKAAKNGEFFHVREFVRVRDHKWAPWRDGVVTKEGTKPAVTFGNDPQGDGGRTWKEVMRRLGPIITLTSVTDNGMEIPEKMINVDKEIQRGKQLAAKKKREETRRQAAAAAGRGGAAAAAGDGSKPAPGVPCAAGTPSGRLVRRLASEWRRCPSRCY